MKRDDWMKDWYLTMLFRLTPIYILIYVGIDYADGFASFGKFYFLTILSFLLLFLDRRIR